MENKELSKLATEIACIVIESGRVDSEGEWWLLSLGAEVAMEADERGYENAAEIAEEAVQLYRSRGIG